MADQLTSERERKDLRMIPLNEIDNVILDVDGVLTDGKQYVDPTGEKLFKRFCGRDIKAIRWLLSKGILVIIVTADDWPGGRAWAWRVGADYSCARDKAAFLRALNIDMEHTLMIGDDAWDKRAMEMVAYPVAPFDCEDCIRELDGVTVLSTRGGDGVVSALTSHLLEE